MGIKKWAEVESSPDFQALDRAGRETVRDEYFQQVVKPQVPVDQLGSVYEAFRTRSASAIARENLPAGVAPSSAGGGRGSVVPKPEPTLLERGLNFARTVKDSAVSSLPGASIPSAERAATLLETPSVEQPSGPSLIEQRGAPVSQEYFDAARAGLSVAKPSDRVKAETARGFRGSVAGAANRDIAAADSGGETVRSLSGSINARADKFIKQGASADTARAKAAAEITTGVAGPMQTAAASYDEGLSDAVVRRAGDIGLSAAKIPPTVLKGFADMAQLATAGTIGADASGALDKANQWVDSRKSVGAQIKAAEFARHSQNGTGATAFNFLLDNPGFLLEQAIPSLGSMALPVGASAAAGRIAAASKWLKALPAAEQAHALEQIREAVTLGTTVAQNSADTFAETKGAAADRYKAAGIAAAGTFLAGKAFDGGAEKLVTRALSGAGRSGDGLLSSAAKAVGKEGGQEFTEAVSQNVGQQVGETGQVDPRAAIRQGVIEGTIGAFVGGGVSIATHRAAIDQTAADHGIPPKAAARIKDQAEALPPEQRAGFVRRAFDALERRGLAKKPGAGTAFETAQAMPSAPGQLANTPEVVGRPAAPTAADLGWATDDAAPAAAAPAPAAPSADPAAPSMSAPPESTAQPGATSAPAPMWQGQPIWPAGQPIAGPDGRQYQPVMLAGKPQFVPVDEITTSQEPPSADGAVRELSVAAERDAVPGGQPARGAEDAGAGGIQRDGRMGVDAAGSAPGLRSDPAVRDGRQPDAALTTEIPANVPTPQDLGAQSSTPQSPQGSPLASSSQPVGAEAGLTDHFTPQAQQGETPSEGAGASQPTPVAPSTDSRPAVGLSFDMDGQRWSVTGHGKKSVSITSDAGRTRTVAPDSPTWSKMAQALPVQSTAQNPEQNPEQQTAPTRKPKPRSHPQAVRGSTALAAISRSLGGLSPNLLADLSQKTQRTRVARSGRKSVYTQWDNPAIPGVGPLFRNGGTADLSLVAQSLEDAGYLTPGTVARDPIAAQQQAQDIVRTELNQGGQTLQAGNPDAVEAEARRRADAAMDDSRDPWEDFNFMPDDLEFSGFEDVSAEVQSAVVAIAAEAEAAGIDIEAIRDEVARQIGEEAPQHAYEAAVQQSLTEALAEARRPAQQAQPERPSESAGGGQQAAEPPSAARSDRADGPDGAVRPEQAADLTLSTAERADGTLAVEGHTKKVRKKLQDAGVPAKSIVDTKRGVTVGKTQAEKAKEVLAQPDSGALDLTAQTADDLKAKTEREAAATKAEATKRAAEQERLRKAAEANDTRDRAARTVDDFQLGQTADEQMSGMGDMFSESSQAQSQPSAADVELDAELQDALGRLGDVLGDVFGAKLNATGQQYGAADLLPALSKVVELLVRKGFRSFKDAAGKAAEVMRADARTAPHVDSITPRQWKAAYDAIAEGYEGTDEEAAMAAMTTADVKAIVSARTKEQPHAPSTNTRVEPDRGNTDAAQSGDGQPVQGRGNRVPGESGRDGEAGRPGVEGLAGDAGLRAGGAPVVRDGGDLALRGDAAGAKPAGRTPGVDDDQRGGGLGDAGVQPDASPASQVARDAEKRASSVGDRQAAQAAADKVAVKLADADNIRATLPLLLDGQRDDVLKAEQRFMKPDGYGMLFTNQPGTGKTYTGLGVIKRFARQGKTNSIIVAPTDKVIEDWIKSGAELGLTITQLSGTSDAGKGIVITTYANFGQNDALAQREWDLVVHDESHYLMQEAGGKDTKALDTLRAITRHPRGSGTRHSMLHRDIVDAMDALREEGKALGQLGAYSPPADHAKAKDIQRRIDTLRAKYNETLDAVKAEVSSNQGAKRTRVTFLSATPFAYEKTVDYAEGFLFDYENADGASYNSGDGREKFFMQHFGYRMRYNKLTAPDAKVDGGLMQRQFNTWLKSQGVLSGRMLDVEPDYDRRFILVDSAIGTRIDEALGWISDKATEARQASKPGATNGYSLLADAINEKFDYLSRRYLLEAAKANEVLPHVREHLAMGRKVVVFHDYKKGGGFNPFRLGNVIDVGDGAADGKAFNGALAEFRREFGDLIAHPFEDMPSPVELFKREIPGVLLFNGDVKPADRRAAVASFQNDDNGPQVILVQSAAGKEGISLHDTTGKHQRVLFNLGQPTQPTTAIQQEGRIYRTGQRTNAIVRYLNTGTNWERWAFASTIAQRASAAENLGMGESARALKDAFIAAFDESSSDHRAGMENEGIGGKERDRAANNALTEYDRARSFYFGTQKKNSKTKAQEGKDYFATPEPLGFKMVEWLGLRGGEKFAEPSAGHGAIARWAPDNTENTAIEPSMVLRSRLAMAFDGTIIPSDFESLHINNKFDGIAMNPPFGVGGKQAVEHLAKAAGHLRDGGRVAAIIPTGPAADKRFDAWFYEEAQRPLKPLGSVVIGGKETPIYKGDTIESSASWAPTGKVSGWRDGAPMVTVAGAPPGSSSMVSPAAIKSVKQTGPRTEAYRPADGLVLVADIKLPDVTFERAGTSVMTRMVVIDKLAKDQAAPGQVSRDLTGIEDVNALFDRLEHMEIPARTKPVDTEQDAPAQPVQRSAIAKQEVKAQAVATAEAAGVQLVEHTTAKGKVIKGVIRKDLTADQAKEVDPYTWRKDGGMFIRAEHLAKLNEKFPAGTQFSRAAQNTDATADLTRVTAVSDAIRSKWVNSPPVVVLADMADPQVPDAVRHEDDAQRSRGAAGAVEGFFHDGTVYLAASSLKTDSDIARVLFHEALGHAGLRGVFGDKLDSVLDRMARALPERVAEKAHGYGLARDMAEARDMVLDDRPDLRGAALDSAATVLLRDHTRIAAEELLAELAQTRPSSTWVQKAVASVREFLRGLGMNLKLTDADIAAQYLVPARGWVERGGSGAAGQGAAMSRRADAAVQIPPSIIGNTLAASNTHPRYSEAKAGDSAAALELARDLVNDGMVAKVRALIGDRKPIVVPVVSVEATGRNKIPLMTAEVLAHRLDLETAADIAQADSPKRTAMDGLDRLLSAPEFDGHVTRGADYLLVDDTLTQGGTFASLASHIRAGGGNVVGSVALTGKRYSATMNLSPDLLSKVRERFNDVEPAFRAATGYGFDALTESEARYIASFKPADAVRTRFAEAGRRAGERLGQETARQEVGAPRFSRGEDFPLTESLDEDSGTLVIYSADTKINAFLSLETDNQGGYEIQESGLPENLRGRGIGIRMYERAAEISTAGGNKLESGGRVSADAQRMYAALSRRGYKVEKNETATLADDGSGDLEAFGSVFTVTKPAAGAGSTRFSRATPPARDATTESALRKAGLVKPGGIREKIKGHFDAAMQLVRDRGELGDAFMQGTLDQFHGINRAVKREVGNLPAEQDPYVAARLANSGTSSVMRGLMLHGQARWAANGQHLEKIDGTRGLLDVLGDLGPDLNDWFGWMIGNRAASLMTEGRENNFTADEIAALQALGKGKEEKFRKVSREYAAFKGSVLDVAEKAGLIDGEARKVWDKADYIPFYRQMDNAGSLNATGKKGLSGQSSGIRTLRGGTEALNDPMENVIMNFSRLIDASLKNNALRRTVDILGNSDTMEKIGYDKTQVSVPAAQVKKMLVDAGMSPQVMSALPASTFAGMAKLWTIAPPTDPDVIRIMRNGKPEFWRVHDPLLLRAATSFIPFNFPGLDVMRAFKRVLTGAVTATPEFMMRNFIRDAVASAIITRDGFNPGRTLAGIGKSWREDGAAEAMLFAGASFQSGNVNAADPEGTASAMRRSLRQRGMSAAAANGFMGTVMDGTASAWEKYRRAGEAIENSSREAVYEAVLSAGKGATAAAYESKDLMDFSLRGSAPVYQLFADVLPFFNARVQGLYRLGRADPKRVAQYGMLMMVASLALAAANSGNDEYEKLPDWDKDTSWHVWIGGQHFRFPKPFELGVAFATIPERIMRYATGDDSGKKAATRIWENVRDQLAFDFVPQTFRPILNIYANKDSFRGSPIENQADEGKRPTERYSASTSATAKVITDAIEPVANEIGLSPKRLEYMVSGYLGTVGMYALGLSDMAVRSLQDEAPRPALRADDIPVVKAFYRVDPGRGSVFENDLFEMRKHFGELQKSVKALEREGELEKAGELRTKYAKELAAGEVLDRGSKFMADMNKQRDMIYRSRTMAPEQKRIELDKLSVMRSDLAKRLMETDTVKAIR